LVKTTSCDIKNCTNLHFNKLHLLNFNILTQSFIVIHLPIISWNRQQLSTGKNDPWRMTTDTATAAKRRQMI